MEVWAGQWTQPANMSVVLVYPLVGVETKDDKVILLNSSDWCYQKTTEFMFSVALIYLKQTLENIQIAHVQWQFSHTEVVEDAYLFVYCNPVSFI